MKKYLIVLISLFLSINAFTQAIGEWRDYLSYNDATKVIPFNNGVYTLSDGSLYSYNTEDNSIKTYNKVNSLSDIDISYIEYSQTLKTLLIVYKNANIDLLIDDNEVYNMSEFMNKSGIQDKAINDVTIDDKYAYLSTNFGIIVINMDNKEITNSYTLNKKVNSIVKINKTFYAATTEGVYKGLITDNLQNASSWNVISNDKYDKLVPFDNKIIANINYDG
ncbi:MAG: Por secretion system protein, partial [Bacteroides sp.]